MSYVETSNLKNSTIMRLYSDKDEIDLNPEYQRSGGVWTVSKKRLLIDSILNDYDLPKLYFHELSDEVSSETGKNFAVIDGRQRLEAIWGFMDGAFTLSPDFEYQRDRGIEMAGMSYSDIASEYPKIRIKFDSFVLPIVVVEVSDDDLDLIEDMFSRLNEAVPLNAAEKRNAFGGYAVSAINKISSHAYFTNNVKFNNARYKHREVAARFMLVEDALSNNKSLVDTKKEYLDSYVKRMKNNNTSVASTKSDVLEVLNLMSRTFTNKDELLLAQGIQTVYYLVFRTALKSNLNINRADLLRFRNSLSTNREDAANDYESASFELLEFDRLNQQGTNDASSIKERYATLCRFLNINIDPNLYKY